MVSLKNDPFSQPNHILSSSLILTLS